MRIKLKTLCGLALISACMGTGLLTSCNSAPAKRPAGEVQEVDKTRMLLSLQVNANEAKTSYTIGETFCADGLTLRAGFKVLGEYSTSYETINLNDNGVVVDYSSFDNSAAGTYTIYVSYTYGNVTRHDSYDVSVVSAFEGLVGLDVSIATSDYTLSLETPSISITPELTVKAINSDGSVGETITDYDVSYYKNGESLASLENISEGGIYQVWVSKAFTSGTETYVAKNFALIYVINNVTSITCTGGTFSQDQGNDEISSTWTYEVTYANGTTKAVSSEDVEVVIDTSSAGEGKVAVATYTEANAKGENVSVSVEVPYTVTAPSGPTMEVAVRYTMSVNDLIADVAAEDSAFVSGSADKAISADRELTIRDEEGNALSESFMTLHASSQTWKLDYKNGKTVTLDDGSSVATVGRLKSGGATSEVSAAKIGRAISFNLEKAATVTVYALAGGSGVRTLTMLDSNFATISTCPAAGADGTPAGLPSGGDPVACEFEVGAGVSYLKFDGNGSNIFYITVDTTKEVAAEAPVQLTKTYITSANDLTIEAKNENVALPSVDENGEATTSIITFRGDTSKAAEVTAKDAQQATVDGVEMTFTKRIKVGGSTNSDETRSCFAFALEGASSIDVYVRCPTAGAGASRPMTFVDKGAVDADQTTGAISDTAIEKHSFTTTKGGNYLLKFAGALDVYYIKVVSTVSA